MPHLREASKAAKWKRIYGAARRQFMRQGYEETTFRSIAAEARVGLGTVHLYAESKQALLAAVWREGVGPLLEAALVDAADKPLLVGARALFEPFLRRYADEPALARVVVKELPWLEGRAAQLHQPDRERFVAALAALVRGEVERGALRADVEPALAASVLFSLYYSACLELLAPPGDGDLERALAGLRARVALVVDGWRVAS